MVMPVKPDRFICKTCDDTYPSASALGRHIRKVRADEAAKKDAQDQQTALSSLVNVNPN